MQNKRDFFSQETNFDWFALLLPQKVQENYPGYLIIYILSSLETNILQTSQIKENSCPSKLMFAWYISVNKTVRCYIKHQRGRHFTLKLVEINI